MLRFVFKGLGERDGVTVGPAEGFRIAGNFVRELPSGKIVARYERFHWAVQGQSYTTYDCRDPAIIYFEEFLGGKSPCFGTFSHIHCADGVMYCDKAFFAKFVDQSLLWQSVDTNTHWQTMVIASPGTVPKDVKPAGSAGG